MANVIAACNRPSLIISPNKTLAGQLYNEFSELFPENAVEYFVSYYDYYQPEAYIPASDTFIEKDASINDRIDRLRHSATTSLLERRDVIVVSSVSCIYGIGSPKDYREMALSLMLNQTLDRDQFLASLIQLQYERNDFDFVRGSFRVRGDAVEIIFPYSEAKSLRVTFFDDKIETLHVMDPLLGKKLETHEKVTIFPAKFYTSTKDVMDRAVTEIQNELKDRLAVLNGQNNLVEAQRLEQRTRYDLEMIKETGFCSGIENYSRFIDGRNPGEPPSVLLNFFPQNFLVFIDESHITVPQIGGMYGGDHSRKRTLVEHGFRLPSALDNRPLNFNEFSNQTRQTIYVSATPGKYEMEKVKEKFAEQIIRPTGLTDPQVEMRPSKNQVNDLLGEIRKVMARGERILVAALTKKMAEQLTDYYGEQDIPVRYLHSDIKTLERMEIIRDLRKGLFSVLIGINLLREGLDLPEVSLIGILEADREGFLRSKTSLIQTFGRAARNINGRIILYADVETKSIREAVSETNRRRSLQEKYNQENNITPQTIIKSREDSLLSIYEKDYVSLDMPPTAKMKNFSSSGALEKEIKKIRRQMIAAAKKYHFEDAAKLRDEMFVLQETIASYY